MGAQVALRLNVRRNPALHPAVDQIIVQPHIRPRVVGRVRRVIPHREPRLAQPWDIHRRVGDHVPAFNVPAHQDFVGDPHSF